MAAINLSTDAADFLLKRPRRYESLEWTSQVCRHRYESEARTVRYRSLGHILPEVKSEAEISTGRRRNKGQIVSKVDVGTEAQRSHSFLLRLELSLPTISAPL